MDIVEPSGVESSEVDPSACPNMRYFASARCWSTSGCCRHRRHTAWKCCIGLVATGLEDLGLALRLVSTPPSRSSQNQHDLLVGMHLDLLLSASPCSSVQEAPALRCSALATVLPSRQNLELELDKLELGKLELGELEVVLTTMMEAVAPLVKPSLPVNGRADCMAQRWSEMCREVHGLFLLGQAREECRGSAASFLVERLCPSAAYRRCRLSTRLCASTPPAHLQLPCFAAVHLLCLPSGAQKMSAT